MIDYPKCVVNLLKDLGIPENTKGFPLICDGIMFVHNNTMTEDYLHHFLYATIRNNYKFTTSAIERSIRLAIGLIKDKGNHELCNMIMGKYEGISNEEFIVSIENYLSEKIDEELI